jgi:tetratricopeptide (TPR) repeat protein
VEAIDRVNAYITANPQNAQALFMKGVLLAGQGRSDEAIRTFTEVAEKFPNLPEPYNNLAVLYADQGQFDKARKALETAIKTHPSYATAHENLGDIYARMASEAYDKALQLDTSNSRAQTKLALIKDLFGTGSKTTIAIKDAVKTDSAKVAIPSKSVEIKKQDALKIEVAKTDKASEKTDHEIQKNNQALTTAVNNWAEAWSSKNLDKYFASYGAGFEPAKGDSRKTWQEQRSERIKSPSKIYIGISNIKIFTIDDNNAKVRFKQTYRADGKPIGTFKILIMRKEGGNWLIQQEIASN